ncbi:MAG: hypothetical protein ACRDPH_03875 [Marmoricola sp.]
MHAGDTPQQHDHPQHHIQLDDLRPTVLRGLWLLAETVLVPTALLYFGMKYYGSVVGLASVLVWCALVVGTRWTLGHRVPSTLLLAVGSLVGRTAIALALSSVYVYLLQPVAASVLMAVLFIGSAAIGRPVTARLAQDFVKLPAQLLADVRVRRMFTEVALLWGVSRLADAGLSLGSLHWGLDVGVLSRGTLSIVLTIASILGCAVWGWRRLHRIPGVKVSMGKPAETLSPAA